MDRFAGALQSVGAVVVMVGLFLVLPYGMAILVIGGLALVGGVVLEVGARPRQVLGAHPLGPADRRAAALDDYRRQASER